MLADVAAGVRKTRWTLEDCTSETDTSHTDVADSIANDLYEVEQRIYSLKADVQAKER